MSPVEGLEINEAREVSHGGTEHLMYPDYLIYDELRRREEKQWEPIPLELPLYQPYWPDEESDQEREDKEDSGQRGVVIIDMIDYTEIDL